MVTAGIPRRTEVLTNLSNRRQTRTVHTIACGRGGEWNLLLKMGVFPRIREVSIAQHFLPDTLIHASTVSKCVTSLIWPQVLLTPRRNKLKETC